MKKIIFLMVLVGLSVPSLYSQGDNNICPDDHHPHMIDLGLPSGTKWACCNVDATKPEEYGGYYAWGETETKDSYEWETYIYYNVNDDVIFIGDDIAGTQYDVAHVKWGSFWKLPKIDQYKELIDYCTMTDTTQNGTRGLFFTGPNGATIFLPAAGGRIGYEMGDSGVNCWSSTANRGAGSDKAYYYSDLQGWNGYTFRRTGYPVRPVYSIDLSISQNHVIMTIGNSTTIDITEGNGNYEISSSNSEIVKAKINGSTITLTAQGLGSAVVTIKDTFNNQTVDIAVSVRSAVSYIPAEAIDLGLPSGTLWASWNLGATKPEEYGGYYSWGETEVKDVYDWNNYTHCEGTSESCRNIGDNIAGTEYDVAHMKWGGSWQMPSRTQIDELIKNCSHEWTSENGVIGDKFISKKNGNSIFLPAAGFYWDENLVSLSEYSYYWSDSQSPDRETHAYGLKSNEDNTSTPRHKRMYGFPVRPVCPPAPIPDLSISQDSVELNAGNTVFIEITSGSGNYELSNSNSSVLEATLDSVTITLKGLSEGSAVVTVKDVSSNQTADIFVAVKSAISYVPAEAIDLGLPSGTLWASWNVGATKPEEYGGYYAWGETEVKEYYNWTTYLHSDGTAESCHFIGDDIAGSLHDVAHVKWGGSWQMPSVDQFKELCNNCTRTWTTQNGVNGTLVTGPNGNTIFFPASGLRWGYELRSAGKNGEYWSSTYYSDSLAWYFYFIPSYWVWYDGRERFYGNAVRPVICQEEPHPSPIKPFFIYRNDSILDAYICSEIDSITYKNENGIFNQVIWQKEEANTIPVSIIDSISFEVPKNIILQIPEEDLNGWDIGYTLGDEYVVAYWDETNNTLVSMINKNGEKEEAGLILCYDVDGNVIKVGNVTKLFNVNYIDGGIQLSRINEEGFFEEEIIPIPHNNPSLVKHAKLNKHSIDFVLYFQKGIAFLGNIQSAQSIGEDIKHWDWMELAKDGALTYLLFQIGKRYPGIVAFLTVSEWVVKFFINQQNERDRYAMYRDCEIEIDEIRPGNGNCVVYATVKNADSLFDFIINDCPENEMTRNLVSCGIVVRINNDYVTTHLCDFKSEEIQLNGDIKYGSEAYFTFTIPGVKLNNNLSTFYFRPYLTSTAFKTNRGDVDEGHIKYGETVPYQAFDGEIIEFNQYDAQYSTDEYHSGFVMFKTSVHASVSSIDNVKEWGVYVYDLNGSGVYDLYPSEYKAAKLEDWIDIDFNINKNEFDEINRDYFLATKNIKLGVYIKIDNPTGTFDYLSEFYSEPQLYELVYNEKPSAITLEAVSTEMTSAVVRCQYLRCAFWDLRCGIEYKSDDSHRTINVFPEHDDEQEIVITGLAPATTYTYRAYFIANGVYYFGEIYEFTTKSGCPDDNHPHVIDLGLPSGTKWACCNVADDPSKQSPTNYGSYYAWGETTEKSVYNEVNYPYSSGVDENGDGWYDDFHEDTSLYGTWRNIGEDIAGTKYDVAHVKWGKPWRMPSYEQIVELWNNCTWNWATKNGKLGMIFTGPNGGSIFLPAAGERWDDDFENKDEYGLYWSSSFYPPAGGLGANILGFNLYGWLSDSYYRYAGLTVRPVQP